MVFALAGQMPFWGGAIGGVPPFMVMQEILGGDIKFDGDAWAGISEDAIDFVDKLLDRDFNTRMTAEQVSNLSTDSIVGVVRFRTGCRCSAVNARVLAAAQPNSHLDGHCHRYIGHCIGILR